MKLSISLSDDDLATLDAYVATSRLPSRSAGVQAAVRQLALAGLEDDYAAAFAEWESSGEAAVWGATSADGLPDAAG